MSASTKSGNGAAVDDDVDAASPDNDDGDDDEVEDDDVEAVYAVDDIREATSSSLKEDLSTACQSATLMSAEADNKYLSVTPGPAEGGANDRAVTVCACATSSCDSVHARVSQRRIPAVWALRACEAEASRGVDHAEAEETRSYPWPYSFSVSGQSEQDRSSSSVGGRSENTCFSPVCSWTGTCCRSTLDLGNIDSSVNVSSPSDTPLLERPSSGRLAETARESGFEEKRATSASSGDEDDVDDDDVEREEEEEEEDDAGESDNADVDVDDDDDDAVDVEDGGMRRCPVPESPVRARRVPRKGRGASNTRMSFSSAQHTYPC